MDSFTYFIAFYSLILGLGLTELLAGFAHMVRAKALKKLEPQTALLAVFVLVDICSVWIDSWLTLKHVTVDFAGLWAPVLIAICLYLAASVSFRTTRPITSGSPIIIGSGSLSSSPCCSRSRC